MGYNKNAPYNDLSDLPPAAFVESQDIFRQLAKASRYLGELNGFCASLPDHQLLINTILLQESRD
ncbi:MAG TPA: Fic/DOC family N-terminal domain-containing protein, partial [Chitinophagaceae bacterium]|nr:Fic/DOC family N-terminal domain-containing protein [Chitinophagaceae bacterium]